LDYYYGKNSWKPFYSIISEGSDHKNNFLNNNILGDFLTSLIDNLFPKNELPQKPKYPSHLPLKLVLTGVSFTGKKTLSLLLK
jgi:hypothetical protein